MAPYLRAWEDKRRDGIEVVYGLVQVISGPTTSVTDIVWEAFDEGLKAQPRFTTTRYLQNTIEAARDSLGGYSVRGWRAGALLAAVSGRDLYLAWAGPAVCYVVAKDQLIYPGYVTEETARSSGALGDAGEVPIRIAHEEIQEGDVVVLAWSQLSNLIEEDNISALIQSGIDPAVRSLYRMASEESEFAMMLLQFDTA